MQFMDGFVKIQVWSEHKDCWWTLQMALSKQHALGWYCSEGKMWTDYYSCPYSSEIWRRTVYSKVLPDFLTYRSSRQAESRSFPLDSRSVKLLTIKKWVCIVCMDGWIDLIWQTVANKQIQIYFSDLQQIFWTVISSCSL